MVFKKPYAFLIKNFRIIHIILTGIIIFIVFKYQNVASFFSEYARANIYNSVGLASTYIGNLIYFAVLIIIAFAIAMLLLMRNKKKPTLFYILLLSYYSVLLIFLLYAGSVMTSLEEASLTQQTARTYRDIYFILAFPQYYFLIMGIIRGIGFDVKKFNFNKDLEELEIKSEDNEEFEFVLGTDTYVYQRKARRTIREIKYYILENKLLFSIIAGVLGVFLLIYIILNVNFINKVYKVGQSGTIGQLNYRLNSAYITQYDYNGNIINKDKKYIIINMTIKNVSGIPAAIDNISMYLNYGNTNLYNQPSLRNYFIDIGKSYINESIGVGVTRDLVFIFEVSTKVNNKTFKLKVLKDIVVNEDNQSTYNYVDFKIVPKNINKAPSRIEKQINEVMYLGETLFKDSNLVITKAELLTKYEYQYESCKKDVCKTYYDIIAPTNPIKDMILVLTYKSTISDNIGLKESMNNDKYFFDKFLKVEYKYNNKTFIKGLNTEVYPAFKNKVFIEIPKAYISKDLFQIMINTRDYNYYINYNTIN